MKTGINGLKVAVAICVVASAASVFAQGGGRRGGGFGRGGLGNDPSFILNSETVQKELEVTADQTAKVQQMQQDGLAFFGELQGLSPEERTKKLDDRAKETKKKLGEILMPQQVERLDQIFLQWRIQNGAPAALTATDVAEKITVNADQKKKLEDLNQELTDKRQQIFQDAQGDFQGAQEKVAKLGTEIKDKALAALTDEQRGKLEKLQGKKFDVTTIQLFGGRGGPGGGRRGGQQN